MVSAAAKKIGNGGNRMTGAKETYPAAGLLCHRLQSDSGNSLAEVT